MKKKVRLTKRQLLETASAVSLGVVLGCDDESEVGFPSSSSSGTGGSDTGGAGGSGTGGSGTGGTGTGGAGGSVEPKALIGISGNADVETAVQQAIASTPGFNFITAGDTVLFKVNVNSGHPYPYSTNPSVVKAVIDLAKAHSAGRIIVADRSNPNYDTMAAMDTAGILDVANAAGVEIFNISNNGFKVVTPAGADGWNDNSGYSIPNVLDEVDHLVNLPACKHHSSVANFTMCFKNWMGIIPQDDRSYIHSENNNIFREKLAELHLERPASYSVLDATRACLTQGPGPGGATADPGLIVASADPIACDVTGLAILKHYLAEQMINNGQITPIDVWEQGVIVRAIELGLGISSAAGFVVEWTEVAIQASLESYIGV